MYATRTRLSRFSTYIFNVVRFSFFGFGRCLASLAIDVIIPPSPRRFFMAFLTRILLVTPVALSRLNFSSCCLLLRARILTPKSPPFS
ncbi:hypothetical protein B0H14DRAFT_1364646 [Mycena olivaceomarginata]|nr:hypothetical protein B0H14DRAFT_1364646 [Mycena olivaceomarginata]